MHASERRTNVNTKSTSDFPEIKVNYLNESLDNLEQYTRKNRLEFHGVYRKLVGVYRRSYSKKF